MKLVASVAICLSSLLLLISAPILISCSVMFLIFYHFSLFGFASPMFPTLPSSLTISGSLNVVFGFLGPVFLSRPDSRFCTALLLVLRIIFFVNSVFLGYVCWMANELRTFILLDINTSVNTREVLENYHQDKMFRQDWDRLQQEYFCCGALNFYNGFMDWRNYPFGLNNSVPDSCCVVETPGCGAGALEATITSKPTIFTDGCLTIVQRKLENEVVNILLVLTAILAVNVISSLVISLVSLHVRKRQVKENPEEVMGKGTQRSLITTRVGSRFKTPKKSASKRTADQEAVENCHRFPIPPNGSYLAVPDPYTTKLTSTV